jgi:thioesterase domain-containing protein
LVAVNEHGAEPPVVFFHTWDDEAEHLRRLGCALGPGQPLYGIEPPDGVDAPFPRRVNDWVDYHHERLLELPVVPPYRFAGFSFGGVVALELARRLEADGVDIAYVGLIDTTRPKLNPEKLGAFLRYHSVELGDVEPSKRKAYVKRALIRRRSHYSERMKRRFRRLARRVTRQKSATKTSADVRQMTELRRSVRKSYLNYEASTYERPVALFHTDMSLAKAGNDHTLRWARYLRGGIDIYSIEGAHLHVFADPHVVANARKFATSLQVAALRSAEAAALHAPN